MANSVLTHGDVKAICDKLECSPMANFSDSPYGGQAKLIRNAAGEGHTASQGHGSTSRTLGQKPMKSGGKVPGYRGGHAKKAPKF